MDATIQTLKIGKTDDGLSTGRQQVVKFLRNYKGTENGMEIRRRNTTFYDNSEEVEDSSGESTSSALQRFNEKLKKKEMERLQKMNRTVCKDSSQEDMDDFHPKKVNKGLIISEDDNSQENQCEVVLSYPSSSSTEFQSHSGNHIDNQSIGLQIDNRVDDVVPYDTVQTFSDASDCEENAPEEDDSTYSSMDEENNGVEMADWNDSEDSVIVGATCVDPVPGSRSSSHLSDQVPSLVTRKTADWLVDDIGPRTAKRKRPAKQAKLPGSLQRRKRINSATTTRPKHLLSLSASQKMSHAKQSTLAVSKETRTSQNSIRVPDSSVNASTPVSSGPDVVSSVPRANSRLNIPTSPRPIVAPGGTPPMRLRVRVQDKVFLIPCPQSNTQEAKNIGWLAEQVSE